MLTNIGKVSRETRYCPILTGTDANNLLHVFKKNVGGNLCWTPSFGANPPGSTGWTEISIVSQCPQAKPVQCAF